MKRVPADRTVWEGEIASYWFDDGFLVSMSKPVQRTAAMAMVSKPGLARFIMALLFKVKPPPIPMKGFSDETSAREWLRQFR